MTWEKFDETPPTEAGIYEWSHCHPLGFQQEFCAEMRIRGAGHTSVLSPKFDYWDGYRVIVPKGFMWRFPEDEDDAKRRAKSHIVELPEIHLRNCPFCRKVPSVSAAQWSYPGGGGGVTICAAPQNYNTWRVEQCCRLIGFNGFKSPQALAASWNAEDKT